MFVVLCESEWIFGCDNQYWIDTYYIKAVDRWKYNQQPDAKDSIDEYLKQRGSKGDPTVGTAANARYWES